MYIFFKKTSLTFALLFCFYFSTSQELFQEIELGKKITTKKVVVMADLNWKKEYKKEDWNRVGLNISILKSLKNNWNFSGGLDNYYVMDSKSIDSYEIRPWVMIHLKSKINNNLHFSQFLKTEWRNFFYTNTHVYDNSNRLRYRFHFDWTVFNKINSVSLKPGIEFYLLKNISNGERYANSREIYLRCSIEKGKKEWHFGIKQESFFESIHPNAEKANTLFLEYKF